MKLQLYVCGFFLGILLQSSLAVAGIGLTYHGRILKPDGSALEAASVQFTIQIRSPGSESCLLYQESQTIDMRDSGGVFSLELAANPAYRVAAGVDGGNSVSKVFANQGTLTLPSCVFGSTYTPNSADGRVLSISFNDGSGVQALSAQKVTYVPYAIESMQVNGYSASQLVRVDSGTAPVLTAANLTVLNDLFNGTLTMNTTGNVTSSGTISGADVRATNFRVYNGSNYVQLSAPALTGNVNFKLPAADGTNNQVLKTDGAGNLSWTTVGGGSVTSVSVTAPLTDSGTATAPSISLPAAATAQSGYLTSTDWNTFNGKLGTSLASGKVWVGNASGIATAANIGLADIRSTITPFDGAFANANCTSSQSMYYDVTSDSFKCQNISLTDNLGKITGNGLKLKSYVGSGSGDPYIILENARGNSSAATSLQSGDALGQINFQGLNDGSSYATGAMIYSTASENWTNATAGTNLIFNTISTGTTANSEKMRIDGSGNVGIGASSINNLLQVGPNGSQTNRYGVYVGSHLSTGGYAQYVGNWNNSGYWGIGPATNSSSDNTVQIGNTSDQRGTWSGTQNLNLVVGGSLGVGTGTPASVADFRGSKAYEPTIVTLNAANDGFSALQTRNKDGVPKGMVGYANPGAAVVPNTMFVASLDNTTPLVLGTNSLERMRILGSGEVGIGTTTPGSELDVKGTLRLSGTTSGYNGFKAAATAGSTVWTLPTADGTSGQILSTNGSGVLSWASAPTASGDFKADGTVAMTGTFRARTGAWNNPSIAFSSSVSTGFYDGGGMIGVSANGSLVGTISANSMILNGSYGPYLRYGSSAGYQPATPTYSFSGDSDTGLFTASANTISLAAGGVEVLRANSSGQVGINTTSPGYNLDVDGTTANVSGAWVVRSDARLKRDVATLENPLETVLNLRGVSFRWNDLEKDQKFGLQRGFIAQEVEQVVPEWVHEGKDGFKRIEKTGIEAYFVEAIKELYKKWLADHDRIAALEKQNQELKEAICEINPQSKICK